MRHLISNTSCDNNDSNNTRNEYNDYNNTCFNDIKNYNIFNCIIDNNDDKNDFDKSGLNVIMLIKLLFVPEIY